MMKVSALAVVAMVLLSADSATADLGLPSTTGLPAVPTVTPPKVLDPVLAATPTLPSVRVPSVTVPSVAAPGVTTPSVTTPSVTTPSVTVPRVPRVPSVTGGTNTNTPSLPGRTPSSNSPAGGSGAATGGSGATSTGGGGGSGAAATTPGARGGTGSRRSAAARRTAVRRDRRLRRTVHGLQGCLGGLSGLEHRVLVLRAGVGAGPPRSRSQVARRLHIGARRVTRLEHRAVRRLRGLAGSGRCGTAAPTAGAAGGDAAGDDAVAIAAGLQGVRVLFGAGAPADRIAVKAERESSHARRADDATPGSSDRSLMALPQARILGFDLTPPLVIALGLAALVWAVRTVRREHPPGPLA
jgi:hypothetical protein